jgi:hypothetical protein
MATRSRHDEEELLEELKALSAIERAKLLKLIRFLKEEMLAQPPARDALEESREASKAAVLRHAGLLADLTPEEEQRFTEAVRRRRLFGRRRVRL